METLGVLSETIGHFTICELGSQYYATEAETSEGLSIDERKDSAEGNLAEARTFGHLKNVYRQIALHPWETLPPNTPDSVSPFGIESHSASEIEEMVAAMLADRSRGAD